MAKLIHSSRRAITKDFFRSFVDGSDVDIREAVEAEMNRLSDVVVVDESVPMNEETPAADVTTDIVANEPVLESAEPTAAPVTPVTNEMNNDDEL
jgi:hypothetical protein